MHTKQWLGTEYNIYYQASAVMVSLPGLPPDFNTWIPAGYIPPDHQKWVALWAEAPWYFAQHQNINSWLQVKFNFRFNFMFFYSLKVLLC